MKKLIRDFLQDQGVDSKIELSAPPKSELGDLAFACFELAKKSGQSPVDAATNLAQKINSVLPDFLREAKAFGPYVNFFLDDDFVFERVISQIEKEGEAFGRHVFGNQETIMVEFGCPNVMKAFHLGHLKNLITGESVARVVENVGFTVVRANYQGDVGMHIAKALWGILDWKEDFVLARQLAVKDRVDFLGRAYVHGSTYFDKGEVEQAEVARINTLVYEESDAEVMSVYKEARQWSLDYFDLIYQKLDCSFDEFAFESETFRRGREIVLEFQKKGVFEESEGAVIFPGSRYDLHDRVFLNAKGLPTYEAKDLALSEKRWQTHPHMKRIIHVVGKDQTEYFKVIFKAEEMMMVPGANKEYHLTGGFLQLKGDVKMSSRKGNVITGDDLLLAVEEAIAEKVSLSEVERKDGGGKDAVGVLAAAALKYGMLKGNVRQDVAFDMKESISTTGDSGPYLLYIVARIRSILEKARSAERVQVQESVHSTEKRLVLKLAEYEEITLESYETLDPSHLARFVFGLAQAFNSFYEECSVILSDGKVNESRERLIRATERVMLSGLGLLGITPAERM